MQVRPQDFAVDAIGRLQHVMVVVPVDAEQHEAQHVSQKDRYERDKRVPGRVVRHMKLEHHDRNHNREYPVTERFESSLCHGCIR